MAESVTQDQFCCPVCLDTLKDPVTTSCGHSFCIVCINNCWDQDDDKGTYSCPQCRKTFTPRPDKQLLEIQRKFQKKIQNREKELNELINAVESHKSFQFLSTPAGSAESHAITISPFISFDDVTTSVSQLREKVEEFWEEQFEEIPDEVKKVQIIPPPKPQTREDFLQYFCPFTLDPNTVNNCLCLSEENKVATRSETELWHPDHPDRFDYCFQVLCRESVSGRCYWEVEWSGDDGVDIAVSYKSISRKGFGNGCVIGWNDQSWTFFCSSSRFSFLHNNEETEIPIMPSSSRIGVYVDYRAGTLSFYSVSDTMKLLHRVQTTFTQPLYPAFWVGLGSKVKLLDLTN